MTQRVAVFVDYQNVYKGARRAFCMRSAPHMDGQVNPLRLAMRLAAARPGRRLSCLRMYRGMPSNRHDPKAYQACQRQLARWSDDWRADVVTRPYNYRVPSAPREKGIDVCIAIDFVMMAMREEFDVGVLVSSDTDLLPALEAVLGIRGPDSVEVAAWLPPTGSSNCLRVPGQKVWCHLLNSTDYERIHDPTDYTRKASRERAGPG